MAAIGGNSRDYQTLVPLLEDARDPDGLGDASREHGWAGSASPCPRFLQHVVPGGNELSGSLSAMVLSLKGAEVPWGHATLA
jgi:hypothetical protein